MIKKIRAYTFSNERPLQERRFVLAASIVAAAVVAVLLSVLTTNQSFVFAIGLAIALAIIFLVSFYSVKTGNIQIGSIIIVAICNLILLPVGYFLGGGLVSGAPIWFSLGIIFVFVLFRGITFWIFLVLTGISFATTMYFGAIHQEWVVPLPEGYSPNIDVYIAVTCMALLCGLLFKFQSAVLEKEIERAEEQRTEIEKLNETQNSFFSSMSHEIRTPINTIIGLNEMTMREKQLPAEVMENTMNIQNASKMLLSIINDLLDMSKIQSGKMQITPGEYDTSRMLSDITNLHWNRAMEKDLRFDIQVGESIPPMLFGDETRIKQVITNLLTNAIKYTEEGAVTLRFGGEMNGTDKFILQVEIEDTGIGIRREDIQYLFDAFRRVEGDDTKNIEGTGLGLAISKQLVEMMGGTITVNSIYTKGSTFRVEIPQGVVKSETAQFRTPGVLLREQPDYQQTFEAPNAMVLVVDDNDMNRIVCQKLLRSTRVQVDLAASGKECLEKTRIKHYDAIFMDHEMPQMDGIETLRKLRQQSDGLCRDTPVIALTANAGSDRSAFYQDQGFSAYLAKPIKPSRLEELLLACLPPDLVEQTFVDGENETVEISETLLKQAFLITTDSICDLPENILRDNEIRVMSYYIQTKQGRFRDYDEINADNVQLLLNTTDQTVSSMPAPVEEYEAFFANALTDARFVLHLSSMKSASSAFDNATTAAESFGNVYVYDAGMISSGLGMMALRAAELFRSGVRLEEAIEDLENYKKRIELQYLVPSLLRSNTKYHTKLLPRVMMNVFNLEPVFTVKKGRLAIRRFLLGYVRSTPDQFVRYCLAKKNDIKTKRLYVTFSACSLEERTHILNEIKRYVEFDEIIANKASAATFINCGPNSFGLIYERETD